MRSVESGRTPPRGLASVEQAWPDILVPEAIAADMSGFVQAGSHRGSWGTSGSLTGKDGYRATAAETVTIAFIPGPVRRAHLLELHGPWVAVTLSRTHDTDSARNADPWPSEITNRRGVSRSVEIDVASYRSGNSWRSLPVAVPLDSQLGSHWLNVIIQLESRDIPIVHGPQLFRIDAIAAYIDARLRAIADRR